MKSYLTKTIFMALYLFCPLFLKVNAQIVYHDQNPDDSVFCGTTSCSDSLNLDINSNGTVDFKFRNTSQIVSVGSGMCTYYITTRNCYVYPKDLNGIASDSIRPVSLIYGSLINSGLVWADTSVFASSNSLSYLRIKSIQHCPPMLPASTTMTGNWYNHLDEYLGVYKIENGLKYYGWIRLSVITASDIIVKGYAYNSTPDEYILAGDSGSISSGIIYHSLSKSEISVYPNPAKNDITIYSEQSGELQLIDNVGQIVYSKQMDERERHIDIRNFSPGIYVVRLSKNETVRTKLICISD